MPVPLPKRGAWYWLLRSFGLEAWFRRIPLTRREGQQERVFLHLALLPGNHHFAPNQLLESVWQDVLRTAHGKGSEVIAHHGPGIRLSWPAEEGSQAAIEAYFAVRDCLRGQSPRSVGALCGASGVGWVRRQPTVSGPRYQGRVLAEVTGMLGETQQLGGGLLISAALRQRLTSALPVCYSLHVAFNLAGHRYPATLYRTDSPPITPSQVLR